MDRTPLPRPTPGCSDENWERLLRFANQKSDEVDIPVRVLKQVIDCHVASGLKPPPDLISSEKRASVNVARRGVLCDFLRDHGECCGKQVDAGWQSSRQQRHARQMLRDMHEHVRKIPGGLLRR